MITTSPLKRISVFIAQRTGLSRRHVEELIQDGRIFHNKKPIRVFAMEPEKFHGSWHIEDRGIMKVIPNEKEEKIKLWAYNKPQGELVTWQDPQGRPTIFQRVRSKISGPLWSVGRLDFYSTGLLLITNTPALAHFLEKSDIERHYEVVLSGASKEKVQKWLKEYQQYYSYDGFRTEETFYRSSSSKQLWISAMDKLEKGITIDGISYAPCKIHILDFCPHNEMIAVEITLREGKNREIRYMMNSMGLRVEELHRLSYGPFNLGSILSKDIKSLPIPEDILKKI